MKEIYFRYNADFQLPEKLVATMKNLKYCGVQTHMFIFGI